MNQGRYRRLLAAALVLGVGIGLFSTGFRLAWDSGLSLVWGTFTEPWHRIAVSTAAGLLIGGIVHFTFYPGTLSTLVKQFHDSGRIPTGDAVPIIPSNLIGLVAGQSAGPEGMMSVVGGAAGSEVAERTGQESSKRLLTLAGMGAGFGTILGAPIGGAMLWLELPHERGIEYYEAIVPTFIASFAGYIVMATLGGFSLFPAWAASAVVPLQFEHLAVAVAIGLVCVPLALVYSNVLTLTGVVFNRWNLPIYVRTTAAGFGIGLLGYAIPLTYFYGGKQINEVLTGEFTLLALAALLGGKMLAAAITVNGNWQGGLIIPHMFMGAVIGRMVALAIPGVGPLLAMLAGMAAFNAAVTGTPLASALIAIALTDGAAISPVFLASLVAFLGSPLVQFIDTTAPRSEGPWFQSDD